MLHGQTNKCVLYMLQTLLLCLFTWKKLRIFCRMNDTIIYESQLYRSLCFFNINYIYIVVFWVWLGWILMEINEVLYWNFTDYPLISVLVQHWCCATFIYKTNVRHQAFVSTSHMSHVYNHQHSTTNSPKKVFVHII
jgi:hypothetical protein